MKVGVIKLGARISFDSMGTSGGTGETVAIIRMLVGADVEVVALTKRLSKEPVNPIPGVTVLDILEHQDKINDLGLDYLLVLNGNVNFFGGQKDEYQISNYHCINHFKYNVFYIYCDPALTLKQLWPAIEGKPWGSDYKKEDIFINREIHYISQPFDVVAVYRDVIAGKNEVMPASITHYPFEKFPCLESALEAQEDWNVDLSYGGTMRGGKREKKMVKFYFDYPENISVEMFGKIDKESFKEKNIADVKVLPKFTPPVKYELMLSKMRSSLAHVVIGDPLYEKIADIPQRCYESINAGCVTFIDAELDKERRVYGKTHPCADFLYVSTKEDVIQRIEKLKSNSNLRTVVLQYQKAAIGFNAREYCLGFKETLLGIKAK